MWRERLLGGKGGKQMGRGKEGQETRKEKVEGW